MQNLSNATTIKIELNLTPEKKSSKREAFSFFPTFSTLLSLSSYRVSFAISPIRQIFFYHHDDVVMM